MEEKTLTLLLAYVVALVRDDGCDAVHVTNLIPPYRIGMRKVPRWTQFPHLSDTDHAALALHGVSYDHLSGWFRRIP